MCLSCDYPYLTHYPASSSCSAAYLNVNRSFICTLMVMCSIIFLFSLLYAGNNKIFMFVIASIPALNFFTDLMYLLTMKFYSREIFHVAIASFRLPNMYFILILYQMYAPPYLSKLYPGYVYISPKLFWLTLDDGYPAMILSLPSEEEIERGNFQPKKYKFRVFKDHDSLHKLFIYCVSFFAVFMYQIFTLMLYVSFLIFICPVIIFWLCLGCFFYQSKIMAMKGIWNMWFSIWTNSDSHSITAEIDTSLLNEAMIIEFLLLSAPQLIIQVTNNSLVYNNWNYFSCISFALTCSSLINGVARYGYFICMKDLDVSCVPLEVNVFNSKYKLKASVSEIDRLTLFKLTEINHDEEKTSSSKTSKIYKNYFKTITDELKSKRADKDYMYERLLVAWSILINHSADSSMVMDLHKLNIKSSSDLAKADAKTLSLILSKFQTQNLDSKIILTEVFKLFPNFDDGSVSIETFSLAGKKSVAEENISIDMI